ncbi:uncharacterized protein [Amphiura filiformis]|uniref:uncharacterized protein n=1 Tax=Amphiura filiformis TaxID=82378 RepID=UPI003B210FF8
MTTEYEGDTITMEYLKNHIKSVLPSLSRKDLNNVAEKLIGMGVERVQDLEFVQKEDLEKTRLNPIQARKLLTTWKPNTADGRRSIAGSAVELPTDTDHLPAEELIDKNRWLKFNVGGVMLETTRDTIDRLQSPFLSLLLDPDSEDVEPPPDGIYRIDRNPEAFQILLDYARYGRIVGNPETLGEEFLLEEIEYYKMDRSVVKCVTDYFDEKKKAPNAGGIEVEKISITEMSLNKEYKHHNSYGITHTTNIACYTSVPGGKGVCQTDVQSLFLYETAYLRFPALFRAPCLKCGHIICFADDPLIGTEGWCHKCHLCLRCQDMLCEGLSDDGDSTGQQSIQEDLIRKTAKVVFLHDPGSSNDPYDFSSPRNGKLALVPYQGGREKTPTQGKTLTFKLPKIPNVMDVPQHSVRANMYRKSNTEHPMSRSFSDFGKW